MRFDDWMNRTNTSNAAFAERAGKTPESWRRYRSGEREPDTATMALIFELTDGEVTPNDWVGVGPRSDAGQQAGS